MTETSIPTNETTPEAVTAAPEEATASTIPASEVPEHPFARIGEDGTVYVKDGDEERVIGGFPEGIPASPYALYERRFADLEATIKLFEDRLASLSPRDIDQTLATLREQVASPNVVGDIPARPPQRPPRSARRSLARSARPPRLRPWPTARPSLSAPRRSSPRIPPRHTGSSRARPCAICWKSGRPSSVAARAWKRLSRTSCGSASPPRAPSSTVTAASSSRSSTRPSPRPSASRKPSSLRPRPCPPPWTGRAPRAPTAS